MHLAMPVTTHDGRSNEFVHLFGHCVRELFLSQAVAYLVRCRGLPFGEGGGPACHNSIADAKIFLSLVRLRE